MTGFEDLISWFIASIRQWHSRVVAPVGGNSASIAIVYPYYSPIAAFLHRVQALLQNAFPFPCTIHVACPYQRSRHRIGYRVDSLDAKDCFAVFVDDGIASGGTLSEVIDEFVSIHNAVKMKLSKAMADPRAEEKSQPSAAILILPFFDRIGMTPRKHLKSIDRYHGDVQFEFKPKYSLNLRSYYAKDCPLCRIESDIDLVFRTYEHVKQQLESNLKQVRDLIAPTNLTAVATCAPIRAMRLLTKDDTTAVVYASDALFSDLASGSDIKRSIRDPEKSSMARLEILLTVMMDPILYRSVHDDQFFKKTIAKEIWNRDVSCEYRCYFLMHIPHLHSIDLSRSILFEVIPNTFIDLPKPIALQLADSLKMLTPTQYFDTHPEVFACILTGIWVLRHKERLSENWDAKWRHALRDTPYAHQFVCGTSLTKEDVARAFAEMLLCNFVTHYKEHREAFQRRIADLRNLIEAGLRTNPIPRHSLVYLMNAIETVRDYYNLEDGLLPPSYTADMLRLYDKWLSGDEIAGVELRKMLVRDFAPEQTIYDATITKQLRDGLAPTTDEVIKRAKNEFDKWLREEARKAAISRTSSDQDSPDESDRVTLLFRNVVSFNNEAKGLRVFGNTQFIVLTVAHFLRNAFESGAGNNTPFSSDRPKFVLTAKKHTENSRELIRIAVTSAQQLTQDEINRCFRAGGGLMAQKQENERWRGLMGGHPNNDGQTVFFLDLEAVEMARRSKL